MSLHNHITQTCLDFISGRKPFKIEPTDKWDSACGEYPLKTMNNRSYFDEEGSLRQYILNKDGSIKDDLLVSCPNCIRKMKEAGL